MGIGFSTREVARLLKLSEQRIRDFVRAGILEDPPEGSKEPLYLDFRDVLVLRMAARLVAHGLPARRVKRALVLLREQIRGERPLSGVQLFADGGKVLASDGQTLWEPESGQQRLRFDRPVGGSPAPPPSAPGQPPSTSSGAGLAALSAEPAGPTLPSTADEWFDIAMKLEHSEPHRAYEAYMKALEMNPEHVEAYINVGRLCSTAGEFERSAAFFRQALRLDPTHPVAHFNLAVSLHDLGELEAARDAYRAAITYDPNFADAHYNLAALLEHLGDRDGARRHRHLYEAVLREPPD